VKELDFQKSEPGKFFRRRFSTGVRKTPGVMDPVPLVTVALLFYLFLLVQSAFVLQPGVTVQLPVSEFRDGAPYNSLVITLAQDNLFLFEDRAVQEADLPAAMAAAVRERPDVTLIIEADRRVSHDKLMSVYNIAGQCGLRRVLLATRGPSTLEPDS
jgi:biopolymer transport protein ExbD